MRSRSHGLLVVLASSMLSSCAASFEPCSDDPGRNLVHDDPRCRSTGAVQAEVRGRLDLFPLLLANLRDPDGEVRLYTSVAVRRLSGVDAGYSPSDSAAEREAAIRVWEAWWQEHESSPGTSPPADDAGMVSGSDGQARGAPAAAGSPDGAVPAGSRDGKEMTRS